MRHGETCCYGQHAILIGGNNMALTQDEINQVTQAVINTLNNSDGVNENELDQFKKSDFYSAWSTRFAELGLTGVIAIPNTTFEEWLWWFQTWAKKYTLNYNTFKDSVDAALADISEDISAIGVDLDGLHEKDVFLETDYNAKLKAIAANQIVISPKPIASLTVLNTKFPNGDNSIYVSVEDGHKYLWDDTQKKWVDGGVYQATPAGMVIGNPVYGNPTVAPYNNLDTLPTNQIVTYASSDILKVANIPSAVNPNTTGATIYTLSHNEQLGGAVQHYFSNTGAMFWRVAWGDPAKYSAWQTTDTTDLPYMSASNTVAPYDDLNTIPLNTTVTYTDNLQKIANIPTGMTDAAGTVKRFGGVDGVGSIQIISTIDSGKIYYRMTWGDNTHWMPWHSVADGNFYLNGKMTGVKTGAPYDDLNTFPMNQTVVIAEGPQTIGQIKHLPNIGPNVGGLNVTSHSWSDHSIGGVQIAIDTDNVMHHRIAWGSDNNWGAWRSDTPDSSVNMRELYPSMSVFQKLGVIGDSYASGELAFDGKNIDHYEISWIQQIARRVGASAINFSIGGSQTRHWLLSDKGLALLNSSDPQEFYVLALGINDRDMFGVSYIGVESDIDGGADTFFGNYGKIIKAVIAKAPASKMVIATLAGSTDATNQFNTAIRTLGTHFGIPVLEVNSDPLFTSALYNNNMVGGHPTAPVYSSMSVAYQRLIEQQMFTNFTYFSTFKK